MGLQTTEDCWKEIDTMLKGGWEYPKKNKRQSPDCLVENCNRKSYCKSLCSFHYYRNLKNIPLDLPFYANRGIRNHNWKGGIFDYPDHWTMKKNRLIKLEQVNGICEVCNKRKAVKIHHKDFSKDNHAIENLLAVCHKCHGLLHKGRTNKTSKWTRFYGMTLEKLCKRLRCSVPTIYNWHKKNCINYFLGKS